MTAIEMVWQETVQAGPLAPLPEDLYTPTLEVGPSATPDFSYAVHRAVGDGVLVEDWERPPTWRDKGTLNFWTANYADIIVYAGWYGPDFYPGVQGVLFVVVSGDASNPEIQLAPIRDGALKIVGGEGHLLYLRTVINNRLLSFDVDARKFGFPLDVGTATPTAF